MTMNSVIRRPASALRAFLHSEAAGGIILMAAALAALIVANSPLASAYFDALHAYVGPLSVLHWINDALMALFFLLVGLEIKREVLDGQLSTWARRTLPGVAALGGMIVPGLVYVAFNLADPAALRGWAIPAATDIAFALGVLSLLGSRVPVSLKVFLAALAIIDDLGAVIVIALFYTAQINIYALLGAAFVFAILRGLGTAGYRKLPAYLVLGAVLWVLVFLSGVHATIAGVLLALTIPLRTARDTPDAAHESSPLHRLEHWLHAPVAFLIVPIFGFANAGVSFAHVTPAVLQDTLTLGVAAGLLLGKLGGVFGAVVLMTRLGWAELPAHANWGQMLGVALLCGIGFTMSLFIGLLAFEDPALQERVKYGILAGSLLAGLAGYTVLRFSGRKVDPS
ncbi:Na(+)/H(+) antiporter NhaA [Azorhizobium oxalatiphilum]|uniref:Na(+)/H(+) antiporter NhaA n=1 Tax=Azorhizobium oxalatiphilum TaxID=980631 RepID=A0A917F5W3_9HYPH|nr:Na+/H+ antiporter NhaA [Azorhizobium oxalatiphilum]GGF52657.1 Na(+)/H(+) antiporter NhaA [Azorhizobium oxalatiphilum]